MIMGAETGDSFSTNSTQENNEPVTTTQGTGRTVQEYYENLRDTNTTTSEDLQNLSNREPIVYNELKSSLNEVRAISDDKAKIPFYDIGKKKEADKKLETAMGTYKGLIEESRQIPKEIEETRASAVGYTGKIASDETVIRAMNPNRLQTLVEANTPLPGQEASVRVVDLTQKQREQRISDAKFAKETREIWYSAENEPSRLPEDKRTQDEKDRDSDETLEKAESIAVDALTANLLKEMNENNSHIREGQKKWELSTPELVRTFAEYAYHTETSQFGVPTEMLREGYVSIERRIYELRKSEPSRESLAEIENLQYFSERVKVIENRARFSMAMWQMSNEINFATNGEQLTPMDFLLNFTDAKNKISDKETYSFRTGKDFKAIIESYSQFSQGLTEEVGTSFFIDEFYDLPMRISEFAGHTDPADLNRQDVPKILAYLAALTEVDEKALNDKGFVGVDIALKVALREVKQIRPDHISFSTILEKVRPNHNIEKPQRELSKITREYGNLLELSGKNLEVQQRFGRKIY